MALELLRIFGRGFPGTVTRHSAERVKQGLALLTIEGFRNLRAEHRLRLRHEKVRQRFGDPDWFGLGTFGACRHPASPSPKNATTLQTKKPVRHGEAFSSTAGK